MTDIIISRLPKYVNQFAATPEAPKPSLFRCGTAAGAMCVDFNQPDKYDPYMIEHSEYVKLVGPDVSTDDNGVTNQIMLQFFRDMGVPIVDMQGLVDEGLQTGNYQPLYDEIEAQNKAGLIQFMSVADESLLIDDNTGASLHPGLHYGHCIVRLGFSTDQGYGFYWDPAAPQACTDPKTGKNVPVRISWSNSILRARPNFCMGIMPPGIAVPPAGFSYQKGTWPAPAKPAPDLTKLVNNLDSMSTMLAQMQNFMNNLSTELKSAQGEV
jgi:hypothetical protein